MEASEYVVAGDESILKNDTLVSAMLVIDGKIYPRLNYTMIDSMYVENEIFVQPKCAVDLYGERAKFGAFVLSLKPGFDYSALGSASLTPVTTEYFIDDKKTTAQIFSKLLTKDIQQMEVKKSKEKEGVMCVYVTMRGVENQE